MGSIGGGETGYLDCPELTKIIVSRIQMVDPENAMKIMGCICLNESKDEMKQLAFSSDNIFLSKINDAKAILSPKTHVLPHQHNTFHLGSRSFSSPMTSHAPGAFWGSDRHGLGDNLEFSPCSYDSVLDEYSIQKQARYLNLDEQLESGSATSRFYYHDAALGNGMSLNSRAIRRTPSLPEFPIKPCHYFSKGYCKHGEKCRYFHGTTTPDGYSQLFIHNSNEYMNDDIGFSPGSLEKLEMEIIELLRSKRGMSVSIASLPMLYFEKYGKNLQAEGYLTESQRHGKAGFSLTKLLARLKSSIRLIDRPHGQHSVILAEDALRFMECRNERSEGAIVSSSHQIYLTFPAESTFTEEDVSNYFKQYGHVHDVRIPCQDKRMFGFVSFLSPETVNLILMKRNPHYICGARVLVKPYREKTRPIERTYMEKINLSMYNPTHYMETDTEIHATPRESDSSRLIRKHLIEEQERLIEHERMLELERMYISEFSLLPKPFTQQPYCSFGVEENKVQESGEFPMENHFSYMNDVLNCCSRSDGKARNASNNSADQENGQIPELPDSPFASPSAITSNIFTIT